MAKNIIFGGLASLRYATDPLRAILTVLWTYNDGILLQKNLAIWSKITNDVKWDKFQVQCLIPCPVPMVKPDDWRSNILHYVMREYNAVMTIKPHEGTDRVVTAIQNQWNWLMYSMKEKEMYPQFSSYLSYVSLLYCAVKIFKRLFYV